MHAIIDVRFTINIDDEKTIPLAMLADFLTQQNIESVILESVVERLDAAMATGSRNNSAAFEPLIEEFDERYATEDLQAALADAGFDSQGN